jgi:nucleotide-binding universal stress UspA family protein
MQMACEMAKMHNAKITALHILEVPFSLPLEAPLTHRLQKASEVLQTAEAIAREEGVDITSEVLRARHISEALMDITKTRSFDLIVLESTMSLEHNTLVTDILPSAPCRVWICHPQNKMIKT